MLELSSGVSALPGIGSARAKSLDKLGLSTVADLLGYYPRDYEDRTKTATIAAAIPEEPVCVAALVAEAPRTSYIRKGLELTKAKVVDGSAAMTVTFFNQSYVRDALVLGENYVFYGRMEVMGGKRQMTNPVFEREERARFTGCIMPVYPLTAGVSNNLLAGLTRRCVEDCGAAVTERLPEEIRRVYDLAPMEFSCRNIHFPESWQSLDLAKRRLIFEEFFYLTCGMALLKKRREKGIGRAFPPQPTDEFLTLLPYTPTGAQRRAMEELAADMASGRPMNRLVQGDVGSGKTLVAAYAAWLCRKSGAQAAMMVPTEILAEQHARSLTALFAEAGLRVGLLTGSMRAAEKKKVRAALAGGEIDLVIGTHALLSEGVEFSRLALVITDEQHRFGVEQRGLLCAKAGALPPHVLVMSATPIPRTLALIMYGDLDVSVIDELPPGRTPIETFLVGESKRARMYGFVRKLVGEGRQAYLVCPMVTEGEESTRDLKAVTEYAETLRTEVFPDLRVGLLHGKMRAREKDEVMARFAAGEIDVLVATTVIEVGVDVPNAALMVVENAERFGLSQLHQLRGRVGRGRYASYCVLVSSNQNEQTRARLKVMTQTGDGFKISEEDLKLRGPGDFFGARQHGLPQLHIADLAGDMRVLKQAQTAAQNLLAEDPTLAQPEHARLLEQVRRLFAENGEIFN